ncbi:hypothetical protein M6B38_236755 [Iris pallida]|uniref:Uncharacterized protein n=1 Tax=Iris pallida TaxID=29817 RepID=A0AAX6DNT0_IRIPA|nr:hypothetical protein M6B38_236755 [Iris pallida]
MARRRALRSSALLEAKVRGDRGDGRCGLRGWSQVLTVAHELRRRSGFEEAVVGSGLRRRRRWCSAELSPSRERESMMMCQIVILGTVH